MENGKKNVTTGPVWDKDNFFLNYISHPYFGATYYVQARTAGYSIFGSFIYSTLVSTFLWEYGVEAFAEIPSIQDIIVTPVFGSIIGEGFYYSINKIKSNNYRLLGSKILGHTSVFLMDPFSSYVKLLF